MNSGQWRTENYTWFYPIVSDIFAADVSKVGVTREKVDLLQSQHSEANRGYGRRKVRKRTTSKKRECSHFYHIGNSDSINGEKQIENKVFLTLFTK